MKYLFFFILIFTTQIFNSQTTIINYKPSNEDFPNPERGFYRYSETRASNYTPLIKNELENYRKLHKPPSANYAIYSSLIFRYFFLDKFTSSTISDDFLTKMEADFSTVREAGLKIIPRFAYTDKVNDIGCSNFICPPYGDAAKDWVLQHINQLKPLLEKNKDIIAVVQMGFIGTWGENYYTDFFGDASNTPNKLLDTNWLDRNEVLSALLKAVPEERMIQVRYPQLKQRLIYGINAPTNSAPLTISNAFSKLPIARIGFHNDCLLSSPDDFGTYADYGNSNSEAFSDLTNLKPYLEKDGKFVAVGGETCDDNYSPQNNCANSDPLAQGDSELKKLHYSFLNSQFNNDVNNDWQDQGCIDNIKKSLGYRFELLDATFSNNSAPGKTISLTIHLKNVGYAAPFNSRKVELILQNTTTSAIWSVPLNTDPRKWFSDNAIYKIQENLCIPSTMPEGEYELFLNLPDPMPSLKNNANYSIRLANLLSDDKDIWQETTGYNKLGHRITIKNTSTNGNCNSESEFSLTSSTLSNTEEIKDNDFKLFPNPSLNEIKISYNNSFHKKAIISVFDVYGSKILTKEITANRFSVKELSSGIYFIKVKIGNAIITKKIIKR